jgi:hypothetical protein
MIRWLHVVFYDAVQSALNSVIPCSVELDGKFFHHEWLTDKDLEGDFRGLFKNYPDNRVHILRKVTRNITQSGELVAYFNFQPDSSLKLELH